MQVDHRDRADDVRLRPVLGEAWMGREGTDPDVQPHRRAQGLGAGATRARSRSAVSRGRRHAAFARSRCRSTTSRGRTPILADELNLDTWRQWMFAWDAHTGEPPAAGPRDRRTGRDRRPIAVIRPSPPARPGWHSIQVFVNGDLSTSIHLAASVRSVDLVVSERYDPQPKDRTMKRSRRFVAVLMLRRRGRRVRPRVRATTTTPTSNTDQRPNAAPSVGRESRSVQAVRRSRPTVQGSSAGMAEDPAQPRRATTRCCRRS